MTKKQLYQFSLTGFDILAIITLVNDGKHLVLTDNNQFKVVDKND